MSGVNFHALDGANKGLSVCFIILIFIINCLLIFMMIKKNGFLKNAKSHILISLAIGDIFLALFSLVVYARVYFELYLSLSCSTQTSAETYLEFLNSFVYGVGLVVLAGELVWRYKRKSSSVNTSISMVRAIVLSSIPWILGLIIVLPLTMAGRCNYDVSISLSRIKAIYGVSVILPACLAVVVCLVVMFIRFVPLTSHTITYQSATPGMVIAPHSAAVGNVYFTTQNQLPQNQAPSFVPQQYVEQQYPPPTYPAQPYIQPYTPGQYPLPQYQAHHGNQPQMLNAAPSYTAQSQIAATPVVQDPGREKNALMAISVVYFICVVPLAAFDIYIFDTAERSLLRYSEINVAVDVALFWLLVFRSVITPIMWIIFSRNQQLVLRNQQFA